MNKENDRKLKIKLYSYVLDKWERHRKGQGQDAHRKRKTAASSQFCLTKSHCITFEQIYQNTPNTDLTDHITHQEIAGNQLHSVSGNLTAFAIL